mgnify:CR=1 FL=1
MAIAQEQKLPKNPETGDAEKFTAAKRIVAKVSTASLPDLALVFTVIVAAVKECIGKPVSAAYVALVGLLVLHLVSVKFFTIKKEKDNAGERSK